MKVYLKENFSLYKKIKNHYEKIFLTLDDNPKANYKGFKRMNAVEWLINK